MSCHSRKSLILTKILAATLAMACFQHISLAQSLRSQAVIDLNFDDPQNPYRDAATLGLSNDNGKSVNNPRLIPSPFWNQRGRRALLLNARRGQYVRIPDSLDSDRPDGLTISFYFLNLHPANDKVTRGIVAKRDDLNKTRQTANYGINYIGSANSIRPYINDGTGFRFPDFSLKNVVGTRRLCYLTAVFQVGDAPGKDTDTDRDDVLIRFYLNGEQQNPAKMIRATKVGKDTWITDVKLGNLLNNVPLTIGSTSDKLEFTSGVIDEFLLFPRALTTAEVKRLFLEVGGADAPKLAVQERQQLPSQKPTITSISPRGLQIGKTNHLTIRGTNLDQSAEIVLPVQGMKSSLKQVNANLIVVELALEKNVAAQYYPLRLKTKNGLSNAFTMAVDRLPHLNLVGKLETNLDHLPAAICGTISGDQRLRYHFVGKKGQRIVADLESKRLGENLESVVEIKTERETPLTIAWGRVDLSGDSRAELTLPTDGRYFVEVHHLTYRAAAGTPFRLKIGDLKLIDSWFPRSLGSASNSKFEGIGTGVENTIPGTAFKKGNGGESTFLAEGKDVGFDGPMPPIETSLVRELLEQPTQPKKLQVIDATFQKNANLPLALNGQIRRPEEIDRYLLSVSPGQTLSFALLGRALNSSLDAEVAIYSLPAKKLLTVKQDSPGSRDPKFPFAIPAGTKQILLTVRDLYDRGGDSFVYRLKISNSTQSDFRLTTPQATLNLPEQGSTVIPVNMTRTGYQGKIRLVVEGDPSVELSPAEISANRSGQMFLTLTRKAKSKAPGLSFIRIVAKSSGLKPEIQRTLSLSTRSRREDVPGFADMLTVAKGSSSSLKIEDLKVSDPVLKGHDVELTYRLKGKPRSANSVIRFSLVSSEKPRRIVPRNPRKGIKPLVRVRRFETNSTTQSQGRVHIVVPLDIAQREIDCVLKAEIVPHVFSSKVYSVVYSKPFKLSVRQAARVSVEKKTQKIPAGKTSTITGTLQRAKKYPGVIQLKLVGLPKGFSASQVMLPEGADSFAFSIRSPKNSRTGLLRNVRIETRNTSGKQIAPSYPLKIEVTMPAAIKKKNAVKKKK